MNVQVDPEQQRKRRSFRFHQTNFYICGGLTALCLISSLLNIDNSCIMAFFAYYTILFAGNSLKHYLCSTMPTMDLLRYTKTVKRYIIAIALIQISYFLLTFMFWTKSDLHPFYCYTHQVLNLHSAVGVVFILHFIWSLMMFIQLLHGYITRKYYLLALGGFQVEVRLKAQREQTNRRLALLEPMFQEYPPFQMQETSKKYRFDDISRQQQGQMICSICLTKDKEDYQPVHTPCKHFFHRQCIQNWAKINSKCPQCRTPFTQQSQQTELVKMHPIQQQPESQQNDQQP